jgi:hypothetical protein
MSFVPSLLVGLLAFAPEAAAAPRPGPAPETLSEREPLPKNNNHGGQYQVIPSWSCTADDSAAMPAWNCAAEKTATSPALAWRCTVEGSEDGKPKLKCGADDQLNAVINFEKRADHGKDIQFVDGVVLVRKDAAPAPLAEEK